MNANMSPIDWAKRPIQKYADFNGRAPRAEFWWYILAVIILSVIARIIDGILGIHVAGPYGLLYLIVAVGLLVPNIAVTVRRLHDTNRTGWWILLPVVPYAVGFFLGGAAIMGGAATGSAMGMGAGMGVAGIFLVIGAVCALVLLVFYCLPGTRGENRYGPDPYGQDMASTFA
jgi:uncharacterized membrane protein YhaH (DUF805 family)